MSTATVAKPVAAFAERVPRTGTPNERPIAPRRWHLPGQHLD